MNCKYSTVCIPYKSNSRQPWQSLFKWSKKLQCLSLTNLWITCIRKYESIVLPSLHFSAAARHQPWHGHHHWDLPHPAACCLHLCCDWWEAQWTSGLCSSGDWLLCAHGSSSRRKHQPRVHLKQLTGFLVWDHMLCGGARFSPEPPLSVFGIDVLHWSRHEPSKILCPSCPGQEFCQPLGKTWHLF